GTRVACAGVHVRGGRRARQEAVNGYGFTSLDEFGDGPGFRKVRAALGVTASGVNGIVFPPGFEGFDHFHDTQDELYFVHRGRARVEVGGETREVGEGGLVHVESNVPRRVSNASETEELVFLAVGGKDGYVPRDGHLVAPERDLARRQAFGSSGLARPERAPRTSSTGGAAFALGSRRCCVGPSGA